MNRRQFIKRAGVFFGVLATRAGDLLRGETSEIPVSLANRSVFASLWDEQGIKGEDVRARIDELPLFPWPDNVMLEQARLERGVQEYYNQDLLNLAVGIDDGGATRHRMTSLLVDSPEMTREQAFLQAIFEVAEGEL